SKRFPGHRFELNKIYRIYRAAARDGSGTNKQEQQPPTACPPDLCFARTVIQWQDQFADCARGLKIGVIDTRIDISHPAFKGQHIERIDFAPDNRPAAPDWHGTGVLAVLAANPNSGAAGLVPGAEFYAANIFFAEENGGIATDTISLMKALEWMRANDVKVINMSFTGPEDDLVRETIEKLSSSGVVLVAAAGNEGPTAEPAYPAAYPQVIAVTAVTKDLHNYRYANRGNHIDVSAPGVDIWTAVPGGLQGYHSGTSFAAPHIAAILALMPRDNFAKNKNDILDSLPVVDLGSPGRDPIYGRGLLVAPPYCSPPSDSVASADR
ncbi:MAG: S8 family serine peptidase, partial [Rhodomicrobium sp.]